MSHPHKNYFSISVVVFAITLANCARLEAAPPKNCVATVFVVEDLLKGVAVTSPDALKRVALGIRGADDDFGKLRVFWRNKLLATYELHDLSAGIFVNWSPDSNAFYLMWSNGGAIGAYKVRAFRIIDGQVTEVPITIKADREFTRKHPCEDRGHNTYAVEWRKGSQELLLALEVYPTSDCGEESGLFVGYLVNATDGTILRRYSERQLKSIWPAGCPSGIYPTGLWGSEDLQKAKAALKATKSN